MQFVHGRKELYNLCLSNRLTREVSTPILYLHHFGASEWAKKPDLYILIEHPRFEYMVNTFTIRIFSSDCRGWGAVNSSPSSLCSCLGLSEKLGAVLINLHNLKVLDIACNLYHRYEGDRHKYLALLKTRVLQRVRFACQYCGIGETDMIKFVGSPCMQSVTSLDWRLSKTSSSSGNHLESFLKNTNALPDLQELHHNGGIFDDIFLRNRPIRRLRGSVYCNRDAFPTRGDLRRGNIVLTHLSLHHFKEYLFDIIEQDPNPLYNLRHIGTLHYYITPHEFGSSLFKDLGRCARLSKLVSFDVYTYSATLTDVEEFLDEHSTQIVAWFPNLRKIFFRLRRGMYVWVRSEQEWEYRRLVLELSYDEFISDWGVLYEKCIADGCTENIAALMGHLED
ncbi:hypothetical protein CPB86DRAFT_417034 [Serendipita vermifera]|nr:hypothetical protein CPB86DRAFT_417034 [Serendipita vermifera]